MTREEFIAELEELVEVDAGTLTPESVLEEIETWDSLAVVAFIALVDERLDFTPSPADIAAAKTVEDLLVVAGLGAQGAAYGAC